MKKMNVMMIMAFLLVSSMAAIPLVTAEDEDETLVIATTSLVPDLDPAFLWDSASGDVVDQVCEGLFAYDLSSPNLNIVPRLAADCGGWNDDATEFTVYLRDNVKFHSGRNFTAADVKYTFDRLNNLIELDMTQIAELYEPLADLYPDTPLLIKNVTVVEDYLVKFYLNYPYTAFQPLLCFTGSYIVDSESTEMDELLQAGTDILIGTGPYKYISNDGNQVVFEAFDDYYRGTPAIQKMTYVLYDDLVAQSQALLSGDVQIAHGWDSEFLEQFQADDGITVGEPRAGTSIYYLGMNNKDISKPFRQAISYAINYSYVISQIYNDQVVRMTSPVPAGIAYHDDTVVPADLDLTVARGYLIDNELAGSLTATSTDQEWIDVATGSSPLGSFNFTWNTGNTKREEIGTLLQTNLKLIGINVELTGVTWEEYLPKLLGAFDELQLYQTGWGADYNDPSNFINPLMSNTSASNSAQINDEWLQTNMMAALAETDPVARGELYSEIQHYLVEDLMPWAYFFCPFSQNAHSVRVSNIQRNAMGKTYYFPVSFDGVDSVIDDIGLEFDCGGGSTPADYTNPYDTGSAGIPGYSFLIVLGVSAATLSALIIRKRK